MFVVDRLTDELIGYLAKRIRAEYQEMPGLCLTRRQMCRLWLLDNQVCDVVIDELIASGFLRSRANGTLVRAT